MQSSPRQNPFSLNGLIPAKRFPALARKLERGLEKLSGLSALNRHYQAIPQTSDSNLALDSILKSFDVDYEFDRSELEHIPRQGPVVVVANHPFGALDGIVLSLILRQYRDNVKVMANYHLAKIPEVRDCFIPVDPFASEHSNKHNIKPLKESLNWLKQGGLLLVFPAGEVSNFNIRKMRVQDGDWNTTIGRLVTLSAATVSPVYFYGRNSLLFNAVGLIHPLLRTCLLPRELLKRSGKTLRLKIGKAIPNSKLKKLKSAEELMRYLKIRTYLLADLDNTELKHCNDVNQQKNIIQQPAASLLTAEVASLPPQQRIISSGEYDVYYAHADEIPWVLQEIGRLRELTFRAVGEGTGNQTDIDLYDSYYVHLFIWQKQKQEIVGAYRLGMANDIIEKFGTKGLYTFSLFHYKNTFVPKLQNAIELGRSFIRVEYQKSMMPLNLLWRGIAKFVAVKKDFPVLFGPVSISSDYQLKSQKLIIEALKHNSFKKEFARYVRARNPFKHQKRYQWRSDDLRAVKDIELVSDMVSQFEIDEKGIPVLVRQYLKLGGQFLGFNVDPEFSDVVDGLIVVDLRETDLNVLQKYMGKDDAQAFREHHHLNDRFNNNSRALR